MPVIVYSNTETNKSKILTENKSLAGIYKWTHISSGRDYIGSSCLSQRFSNYFSKPYLELNKSMHICNALALYGYSKFYLYGYPKFSLTILKYIDITNLSKEEARLLILLSEQKFRGFTKA